MKVINDGLPEPLYRAILNDDYDDGGSDITVTSLIRPPRMVALERQYNGEITEPASGRIWALLGQIGHGILERASDCRITEKRFFTEILGWKVSCKVDLFTDSNNGYYGTRTSLDYKFLSVWTVKDGVKQEYVAQLNFGRYIAAQNGECVDALQIVAIYRDWSRLEALRDRDYPQKQVEVFPVAVWDLELAGALLKERVKLHQEARKELPQCTPQETWERPDKWAVMKEGRKSALRVLDSESEALLWAIENDHAKHDDKGTYKWGSYTVAFRSGISIVRRPGERVRCASYCSVVGFCEQWNKHQKTDL